MSATVALAALALALMCTGLVLAVVMGRRGHDPFGWWLLGTVLGPLALPLALSAERKRRSAVVRILRQGTPGGGPVDVLVGIDGSPEAAAALMAALDLLGPRLGRLTLAAVTHPDGSVEQRREVARSCAELERRAAVAETWLTEHALLLADRGCAPELVLEVGQPAEVLQRLAVEGGYDVLVAGTRGAGLSKAVLGSVARELVAHAKVPVLLSGESSGGQTCITS